LFGELRIKKALADDKIADFLQVYRAFKADPGSDRGRAWRLEKRVGALWDQLSEDQRAMVVETLVAKGELPAVIGRVLEIFGGKVVSLI